MFKYDDVIPVAETLAACLTPVCEQVSIAGSLRRKKPQVGDMEIVARPILREVKDMFNVVVDYIPKGLDEVLCALVRANVLLPGDKNGPRYKQFEVQIPHRGRIKLDLFLVLPPAQWGVIVMQRTGAAEFSKCLVTQRNKGGLLPPHLHVEDGAIWEGDKMIETPAEEDVFKICGLKWMEPEFRMGWVRL